MQIEIKGGTAADFRRRLKRLLSREDGVLCHEHGCPVRRAEIEAELYGDEDEDADERL